MREFNLNQTDEIEGVKRVVDEPPKKQIQFPTVERLTTYLFISLCFIVGIFAIRTIHHVRTLHEYAVPDDAYVSQDDTTNNEDETTYVNQVVYNPSKLGKKLAKLQNNYDVSNVDAMMGEPVWYSGDKRKTNFKWKFMSDYEYTSAKIDCIWLCTNDDGIVLAFHTATYDGSENTFTNALTKMTEEGVKYIAAD